MTIKRSVLLAAVLLVCLSFLSGAAFADHSFAAEPVVAQPDVVEDAPVSDSVLTARIAHMLSLNFVYDDAADNDFDLIQNSAIALLDTAEEHNGFLYIKSSLLKGLIFNLYGRRVDISDADLGFMPAVEGYVAIVPRGYDTFEHKLISVEPAVAGLTVTSIMTVYPHDGEPYSVRCVTEFAVNSESSFGYSIIKSCTSES